MRPRRPYLLRAMIEWIVDSGCTPYVVVAAGLPGVDVPPEHVQDGRIVLNVSAQAVGSFDLDDEALSLTCRFNGVSRHVRAPLGAVVAVFARETGEGMVFEPEADAQLTGAEPAAAGNSAPTDGATEERDDNDPPPRGGPGLRVVK